MQTQVEENNETLRTDLKFELAFTEKLKIDTYNYYLDGSDQFEIAQGLNLTEFE